MTDPAANPAAPAATPLYGVRLPAFGMSSVTPPAEARAVWGARTIQVNPSRDYPATLDIVGDRQDIVAGTDADRKALLDALNNGVLRKAQEAFGRAYNVGLMSGRDSNIVVLYRDADVVVAASCQQSHGYVYVYAWLGGGDGPVAIYPEAPAPEPKKRTRKPTRRSY